MRLSEAQQDELAFEMESKSLVEVRAWLIEKRGVRMSPSACSRFFAWYHARRALKDSRDLTNELRRELAEHKDNSLDDDTINLVAQRHFELLAMKQQNPKLFIGLRRLRISERTLALEVEKFRKQMQTDMEKALDAFHAEVRAHPDAVKAFQAFRDTVRTILARKAA
jgi:hypothetical protein